MGFDNPFTCPGNWYKANLHAHTTESDGLAPPDRVASEYRKQGYHVLAITDHNTVTEASKFSTDDYLCIEGIEIGCGESDTGSSFHVVGIDVDSALNGATADHPQQLLDAIAENGGIGFIAHPYWSCLTAGDLHGLERCLGVEVINYGCECGIGKGISSVHWDDLLVRGDRYLGLGVDDGHRCGWDFYGGFTMIKAPDLSREAIIAALRAGRAYASMGPIIEDLQVSDHQITVRCSPADRIYFVADNQKGACLYHVGGPQLTEARYFITGSEQYVRVEIIDAHGAKAWSQPLFFER